MISRVRARAFANIALIKYWGKRDGGANVPATSSVSLALEALLTVTEVTRIKGRHDRIRINDRPADKDTSRRIGDYLDMWRRCGLVTGRFEVFSRNGFPTAAGLSSSSSGFAALAAALSGFADRRISGPALSRLARLGSGSAARSIPGGLAVMPRGTNPGSHCIMPPAEVPWGMVIAIADAGRKKTGSRQGMELSRTSSPYYRAWISRSGIDYAEMLRAIAAREFAAIGTIAEQNALAMHACMMATRPSLLYWSATTIDLIRAAGRFREDGLETYFTIDAGPNVIFLCRIEDAGKLARRIKGVKGVRGVIASRPAGGAEITECA